MVLKSKSKFHKGKGKQFYEESTIVHEGKKFTSGGSFIGKSKEGKLGGILYAYPDENKVGSWDKSVTYPAEFDTEWMSNMGDVRQTVRFKIGDKKFVGTYYKSGSDIVRFKEVKSGKKLKELV